MMQRYIYFLAACMAVIFAASCEKEQGQSSIPEDISYDELTINGTVTTKTVLKNDNTVDWSVGDAISVFSTNISGGNNRFDSSHSAIIHETIFSGKIESGTTGVVALYPYTAGAAYSEGTVTGMSIPTTQTATESSFANGASVTIAKGTKAADAKTITLTFQNLCSVLKFTVPEGVMTSSSIRVESINSAVKMSGAVSINSSSEDITSAATAYVDLAGTFTAGKTYCVTVAPGNYDQGFRFTITGTNGTTLVREAPAVNAEKGKVYNVGALNPVISGDPVTCQISHSYENSTLTGSDATITLSAPQDEFASNVKSWRLENVTIKSQDGTVTYRTLTNGTSSVNGQPIALSQVSGLPYIPHGSYTLSADIYYTVKKADGTLAEKLFQSNFTKTVTSPTPDASKFTLDANIFGYTSYNYGTGTDKTKDVNYANNLSPTRIYEIDATYKSGLSAGVAAQCQSLFSAAMTLDGSTFTYDAADGKGSGNQKGSQSWASHTLGALLSFDGSAQQTCATTRTVHITGLPYSAVPPKKGEWSGESNARRIFNWEDSYLEMEGVSASPITNSPNFYIPNQFPVIVFGKITATGVSSVKRSVKLGGGDPDDSNTWCVKKSFNKNDGDWNYNMDSYNLTSSKNYIEIEHGRGTMGPSTRVYSVYVQYR